MFSVLRRMLAWLRTISPEFAEALTTFARQIFARRVGTFPQTMAGEIAAVKEVLRGPYWNMAYGKNLVHERLEAAFCDYLGSSNAVAVNTGGMALQMSLRALGLKPGDEVLVQVDTCSAAAFAIMNAGATPIFSDISPKTFMLPNDLEFPESIKAVVATHMWGNPQDVHELRRRCDRRGILLIEDACLSLGADVAGRKVGTTGATGVFSFGCLKPIQAGEGGMIVTDDEALARELRSLRHWGDRTIDYGVRDTVQLAWNGRMSEIVAAVALEQLKGFPAHLAEIRENVDEFRRALERIDGLELQLGAASSPESCTFTQIVLRVDPRRLGVTSEMLRGILNRRGIATWLPNFEPVTTLSFFAQNHWRDWIIRGDVERVAANYGSGFSESVGAAAIHGLGIPKQNFSARMRLRHLVKELQSALVAAKAA